MSRLNSFEKQLKGETSTPTPPPVRSKGVIIGDPFKEVKPRQPRKKKMPELIAEMFKDIHEDLDKAWGTDNKKFRETGKFKYKNQWKKWLRILDYLKKEFKGFDI